ncbi:MAG: glycosyl hydrolase family 53 [Paenibacillus sp.]|nr:glycosyl hydrolase family 53 [Paenibacillus sp.]
MNELFFKGMTYGWGAKRGDYRTSSAVKSMEKLADTGSEWIALSFWTWQDTIHSTKIYYDYGYTPTDRDIEFAVKQAKQLGLKVCLKPVVNSKDGIWRARIGFPEEADQYWSEWFASYTNFIKHYAELAAELGCEMFCIGCEMVATETRSLEWRTLIKEVRSIYNGPIIYNANHGKEEGIDWLDAVDLIGISAYYPVASIPGETYENMRKEWEKQKPRLKSLSERFKKSIVFIEIGCRSALGCATMPWDFTHTDLPVSEREQANFYRSALEVFWNEPWFSGYFWWDWRTHLYELEEASKDAGFDIYGKEAEQILKEFYKLPVLRS